MKAACKTILLMGIAVVLWSGVAVAEDADWTGPGRRPRSGMMAGERADRILDRIEQTDPEKAGELRLLRDKDPNEFQKQLREYFRDEFGGRRGRMGEQKGRMSRGRMGDQEGRMPRGRNQKGFGEGPMRERMWRDHTRFMSWLTENYPEQAEQLNKLQQEDPEEYFKQLHSTMKTYKPIMKASMKNPELAEVLKEDLNLKAQRKELLEEIKSATDESEKEQLKNQLEQLVAERFELIIKRKQARYEQLLEKLESLKKQVELRKNEVDTLKSQKADKVKERVKELLSDIEKINWD